MLASIGVHQAMESSSASAFVSASGQLADREKGYKVHDAAVSLAFTAFDSGTRFRFGGMAPPERVPNL